MRLEIASSKAIKYACLNFHYAKSIPNVSIAYSVFNNKNEWCGVICYGVGANQYISNEFNLNKGEVCELLRVALNGKQENVSKSLSISLRLLKKHAPLIKLVVSYADNNQNHFGTIYQATNWYYIGEYANERGIMLNGKLTHRRSINSKYKTNGIEWLKKNVDAKAEVIIGKCKFKYIYPLYPEMIEFCKKLSKQYPKKEI